MELSGLLREGLYAPLVFLAYARRPSQPLPRRWQGLVNYGRLDILVRVVLASLFPQGVVEKGVQLLAFLERGGGEGEVILFDGSCLPGRAVYEHDVGPYVLEALAGRRCGRAGAGYREVLGELRSLGYRVVVLHESGRRLSRYTPYTVYIVGLREDPPLGVGEDAVESVGPRSYLASHVVAFIRLASTIPTLAGDEG